MTKRNLSTSGFILLFSLSLTIFLFPSCSKNLKQRIDTDIYRVNGSSVVDSKLLKIYPNDNFYLVDIKNPWDTAKNIATYILVNDSTVIPNELHDETVIRYPLKSAVVSSSSQCSFLEEVDGMSIVEGAGDLEFLKSSVILEKKAKNEIYNVGTIYQIDAEVLLSHKPEVIFIDPVIGQDFSRIQNDNLKIIFTPDYLENTPLGRLEWIKLYAILMNQSAKGDSIYQKRKEIYQRLKHKLAGIEEKPSVFLDLPYQGNWNVSGGKSYIATMIKDAGADYIWGNDNKFDFTPLSFEAVLEKAGMADIWLIKYYGANDLSYAQMKAEYKPYIYFKPFKDRKIWGNNTMKSSYYEDLPIKPHLILEEMAAIFHPDLFSGHEFKYYSPLR